MDYEIFFPVNKNVTKSNFYYQKFWKDFGNYNHIKTQIVPQKRHVQCMSQGCTICLVYTSDSHTFIGKHEKELDENDLCKFAKHALTVYGRAISAIRNMKLLLALFE